MKLSQTLDLVEAQVAQESVTEYRQVGCAPRVSRNENASSFSVDLVANTQDAYSREIIWRRPETSPQGAVTMLAFYTLNHAVVVDAVTDFPWKIKKAKGG